MDPNKDFTMEIEDSCPFSISQQTQYSFDVNETRDELSGSLNESFSGSPAYCSTQMQSQQLFFT